MLSDYKSEKFAHRATPSGTFDSICLTCFRTIATVRAEAHLAERESNHRCDPIDLRVATVKRPPASETVVPQPRVSVVSRKK